MSDTLASLWNHAADGGYTHTETDEDGITKAVQVETEEGLFGEAFGALYAERVDQDGDGATYRVARCEGPVPDGESLATDPAHIEGGVFDYETAPVEDLETFTEQAEEAYMDSMMGNMLDMLDAALGEDPEETESPDTDYDVSAMQPFTATSRDDLDTIHDELYGGV